jgi:type II secretory pathway component GspD/PulD (secretin)
MAPAVSGIGLSLVSMLFLTASWVYASTETVPAGAFRLEASPSQRVSLTANDADLNEILVQLGRELDIAVTSSLPPDARVTVEFTDLPLSKALKRMAGSYMLIADEVDGRVARIFVLPEADGSYERAVPDPESGDDDARPAEGSSFQFEFDPDAVPVEDEDEPEPPDQ